MTTTKDALPELPEAFDTIIGLQGDGDEAEPVEWPVFTIDQVRAYALAALASKQAPTEPFWHAVVSNKSPVINKAIRREDVAQEYADQCNEQGYRDAEVVPLYLASRPAEAQAKSEPAASALVANDGDKLWLWQNGDHFLAFRNLYPCFSPGGDPMTLGEPAAVAYFKESHNRTGKANT